MSFSNFSFLCFCSNADIAIIELIIYRNTKMQTSFHLYVLWATCMFVKKIHNLKAISKRKEIRSISSRDRRWSLNRSSENRSCGKQVRRKRVTFYVCKTRTAVSRSVKAISVMTMTCSMGSSAFHNNSHGIHAPGKLVSNCFGTRAKWQENER